MVIQCGKGPGIAYGPIPCILIKIQEWGINDRVFSNLNRDATRGRSAGWGANRTGMGWGGTPWEGTLGSPKGYHGRDLFSTSPLRPLRRFSSSPLLLFSTSLLRLLRLFASSPLLLFSSSRLFLFSSSPLLLLFFSSHLLLFSSSPLILFSSSPLLLFSSSPLLLFSSSPLLLFSSFS